MKPSHTVGGKVAPQAIIFPLLVLIAVSSILYWYARRESGDGNLRLSGIVEGDLVQLGSKVGGRLLSVSVQEGQSVKAGDVVAKFDIPELEAQHAQLLALLDEATAGLERVKNGPRPQEIAGARAGVDAARASLDELLAGTRQEDIAQAEAAVHQVEAQMQLADADLARAQKLYDQDVLPRKDLDAALTRVDSLQQQHEAAEQAFQKALAGPRQETIDAASARVDSAQATLNLLKAGSRSEDIAMASSRLDAVKAQLEGLEAQIAEATVAAPGDGIVLTRNHVAGDLVGPGAPVVTVLVGGSYYVQTFIPEANLSWAVPGAKAQVAVDTLPDKQFTGTVEFLSVSGEFTPRNLQTKEDRVEQVYRCKVAMDDPERLLRPGMACDLIFSPPAGQGQ